MSANSPPQDSGSQSSVVWVLRILAAAAVGWLIWGWMEYSGPYKWASELQLQMAGSYDEKLSFIGPLIVIAVIVGVLSSMFGATGQLMGGATGDRLRRAGQPATAVDQRRSARVVLLLGAATTLGGALVAGYGFLPHAPASIGTLDITAGEHAPPDTDRVAFTGVERRQFARGARDQEHRLRDANDVHTVDQRRVAAWRSDRVLPRNDEHVWGAVVYRGRGRTRWFDHPAGGAVP